MKLNEKSKKQSVKNLLLNVEEKMAEMYTEDRDALLAEIDRMKLDEECKVKEISAGHWEEKKFFGRI